MPLLCCCGRHLTGNEFAEDYALSVLQPTDPPSIPYAVLQPRLQGKHSSSQNKRLFENQRLPNAADNLRRPSITTQGVAGLDDLIVDDSESENGTQRSDKRLKGTFDAVRTKLIRRISQDASNKRQSNVSLGNSQEEISRRAELKRLMHKRIQDELHDEQGDKQKGNKSDDGSSKKSAQGHPYLPSVIFGPRDNIEFAVLAFPSPGSQQTHGKDRGQAADECEEHLDSPGRPRRCSCPEYALDHGHQRKSVERVAHGDRSSLPDLGTDCHVPKPAPTPGNLSLSPSQISFQLSNSASNSATRLDRVHDPMNGLTSRQGSSSWDGHSALGVWLIAQGFRSRENSTILLEDLENDDSTSINDNHEYQGGVDRDTETSDLSNHRDANPLLDLPSGPMKPVLFETRDGHATVLNAATLRLSDPGEEILRRHNNTQASSSGDTPSPCSKTTVLNTQVDSSSSRYPSVLPSFQPSPARSQPNVNTLSLEELECFPLSPIEWYESFSLSRKIGNSEEHQGSSDTARDRQSSEPIKHTDSRGYQHPTQIAYDTVSMSQSETASFLQREAELSSIEKRFSQVLSRKKLSSPVASRFREEFEAVDPKESRHASFLSMIHLPVPKRFKAGSRSQDQAESLSAPSGISNDLSKPSKSSGTGDVIASKHPSHMSLGSSKRPLSADVYRIPVRTESATDLWQRAIQLEAQERRGSSNRQSSPNPEHEKTLSSGKSLNLALGTWKGAPPTESSQASTELRPYAEKFPHSDQESHSKWLIQHWVAQMLPDKSKSPNKETQISASGRESIRPPQSWARYPSHTRDERTASATLQDQVKPKDFAIKQISPDGQILWSTDLDPDRSRLSRLSTRSLSFKLGKAVKAKVFKFKLSKSKLGDEANNTLNGRRGSAQAGGYLDYPELEILPTESGYQELKALERQIENIKGSTRQTETGEPLSRRKSGISLGSRISALMYEAAEQLHDHDEETGLHGSQADPATPKARSPSYRRNSSALTEIFVTPQSRFSMGDSPAQERPCSDRESIRSDGLVVTMARKADLDSDNRPRSSTWTGQSLGKLPKIIKLDDFQTELKSIIQRKTKSSSGSSFQKKAASRSEDDTEAQF